MDDYISKPIRSEQLSRVVDIFRPKPSTQDREGEADDNPDKVFDEAELLERLNGNTEFLKDLLTTFQSDCRMLLPEIREAVSQRDREALLRATHTLKGSVSNLEAKDALEAAHKLETIGRENDWPAVEQCFAELERRFERLEQILINLKEDRAL